MNDSLVQINHRQGLLFRARITAKRVGWTAFVPFLALGCIPEKRIVWSPDGSAAAVFSENGLHLIDGDGRVLPARFSAGPTRGDWFGDGRRLAVVHQDKARTWRDLQSVLTKEEATRVREVSEAELRRLMGFQGNLKDFGFDPAGELSGGLKAAALVYLREQHPQELASKLGDDWENLRTAEPAITRLSIVGLEAGQFRLVRTLVSTLDAIQQPSPSPDGAYIAYAAAAGLGGGDERCLWVTGANGSAPRIVARNVALAFDWSPDGRSLAFVRASAKAPDELSLQLGSLSTVAVRDESGALLGDISEPEDKAGIIFNEAMSVAWLKDDRILFSSAELTLPATSHDMPQRWGLFAYDPRWQATIIRVTGRKFMEPVDMAVPLFEISPDETRALIPCAGGRLVVYNIQTGETTRLQESETGPIKALPTWRGNDEVCHAVGASEGTPTSVARVMMWKDGSWRVLSADWPETMTDKWLTGE